MIVQLQLWKGGKERSSQPEGGDVGVEKKERGKVPRKWIRFQGPIQPSLPGQLAEFAGLLSLQSLLSLSCILLHLFPSREANNIHSQLHTISSSVKLTKTTPALRVRENP